MQRWLLSIAAMLLLSGCTVHIGVTVITSRPVVLTPTTSPSVPRWLPGERKAVRQMLCQIEEQRCAP